MKRNVFIFFVIILLLAFHVSAENVIDNANLLTEEEENSLSEAITVIGNNYSFDVVILTTEDTEGKEIESFADDYYDYNGYGYGSAYDGMLFVIDMSERIFTTSTCGSGIYLFSDYTLDNIHNEIIPYLSSEDYYTAFSEYLSQAEYVLRSAFAQPDNDAYTPELPDSYYDHSEYNESLYTYDEYEKDGSFYLTFEIGVIVISLIIGLITVSVMKSGMKNIGISKNANNYTGRDKLTLIRSVDRFMYSNVTKTRINNDSNNSHRSGSSFGGGHSSTRIGSSGRSHGGRSGHF